MSGATRRLFAFGVAWAGLVVAVAEGYRFFPNHDAVLIPLAAEALRWDPDIWGPGETLEFLIAGEDPGWEAAGVVPEAARSPMETALARWAAVSGADIRWRIGGIVSAPRAGKDEQNTITVNEDAEIDFSFAQFLFLREPDSGWRVIECDVVLSQNHVAEIFGVLGQSVVAHEFGHCLGLAHTWAPNIWAGRVDERPDLWGAAPKMSYGFDTHTRLLPDDIVGARLLRPDPAWNRDDEGSIAGAVTVRNEPAAHVYVVASPILGEQQQGIGAFADGEGLFEIEGLEPGDYRLRASPIQRSDAHQNLVMYGAVLDVGDSLALGLVAVRAGEVTGFVELELPDRPER